ncbi:hypothetical protein KFU94_68765 [Chloroflexi bacterium TSY]|nr:hypothetical protein [Chloroflexi bacterium TSY]
MNIKASTKQTPIWLILSALVILIVSGCVIQPIAANSGITEEEVIQAQERWGSAVAAIGEAYTNGEDYVALAEETVDTLYAYGEDAVLFKPTKAASEQFRLTREAAISYFVTGAVAEDKGFAMQPWSAVRFENAGIILNGESAIAMGNYYFTDANTGEDAKVEYTFGYQQDENGGLRINLHHSSFPYVPAK